MKFFGKELKFNNNKVYHAGDKPTPAEIGAAASSHTHNYAGSSSAGGAANSANTLATARTINGTSFNGSANITTANWGAARTLTIGNSGKSVNGSGNISWSWSEMQVPRAYSSSYNFGGNQNAITTAQFLTMLGNLGAFSQPYWVSRGSWSYASNQYINDTGCGNIHLAGCTVEVIGSSTTNCTIRVMTPTTSSSGVSNGEFIYINNGDGYSPGWRRQYNTKYKPSASEIGALPTSGGTMTGDLTCNQYFKINAWSGYGSGTADLWYNGSSGNIHCSSGIRTDKSLHSAWQNTFEDGFNIPTRDGGNRRGVLFNIFGSGDNSYLEIARRNSADTDWDWGNSIKFYPHEVKVPSLQCYSGGGCFKLYPGNAGHTYMGFFLDGNTRGAWMGYGSNGSKQFTISADGGTGRVDIHNLNVHGIPLSIQSSAPGCGGVWIQI